MHYIYNIVLCSAPYFELLGEASFNMVDLFMDMFNSNIIYLHLQEHNWIKHALLTQSYQEGPLWSMLLLSIQIM